MATYTEQIDAAFAQAKLQGKTTAEAYAALKSKLSGNATAMQTLENVYSRQSQSTKTSQSGTDIQGNVDPYMPAGAKSMSASSTSTPQKIQSWNLSSWNTSGSGTWTKQPVLTINGEQFKFDTPQEYVNKLQEVKGAGGTGNLDQMIQEFNNPNVASEFQRKPPSSTTDTKYTYKDGSYTMNGSTYTQAELDKIAQNASPDQREAINKQFGTAYPRAAPAGQIIDANHPPTKSNTQADTKTSPANTGVVPPANTPDGFTEDPITGERTYTFQGKQYNQSQIDAAYMKGTPDQRSALNAKLKLSYDVNTGKPSDYSSAAERKASEDAAKNAMTEAQKANTPDRKGVDISQINATASDFKTGYDAYMKAQTDVYGIDTARQNQQYQNQQADALKSNTRNNQDSQTALNKANQNIDYQKQDVTKSGQRTAADLLNAQNKGNQNFEYQKQDASTQVGRSQQDLATNQATGLQNFAWQGQDLATNQAQTQQDSATSLQRGNQAFDYQNQDLSRSMARNTQDSATSLNRGLESYGNQASDASMSINRNREDYARFTGQEIKDTSRQLALQNASFAKSLTNASRAYGQRGILQAGVQKASLGEGVKEFGDSQDYFKTLSQRRLESAAIGQSRNEQDYTTGAQRLDTAKGQFVSDNSQNLARSQEDFGIQTGRLGTKQGQFQSDTELALSRANQQYGTQIGRLGTKQEQFVTEGAKDLSRLNQDYATSSGRINTQQGQFNTDNATAMSRASQDTNTSMERLGTQQQQIKTEIDTQLSRLNEDYSTAASRLGVSIQQYAQDRSAGLQVLLAQLKQQGNSLFNQTQIQRVQLAQQQADQAAIDALYGRTPQQATINTNIY